MKIIIILTLSIILIILLVSIFFLGKYLRIRKMNGDIDLSKYKKVITNKGILYYYIEASTTFDYLHLYKLTSKKIIFDILFYKKEFIVKKLKKVKDPAHKNFGGYWYLQQDGDRVNEIKKTIRKAINRTENFDPEWDGIMVTDKALLRELLINDITNE